MEYCVNCIHLDIGEYCTSPKIPNHMVTGKIQVWTALHCRNLPISGCGEDAKWFEFIKEQDLDDLSTIPFGRQA